MPSQLESPDKDAALRRHFPTLSEEAIVEAENVLRDTQLSAAELYVKWETFAMQRKRGTEAPTPADLRELRSDVLKGSARKPRTPVKQEPRARTRVTPARAPPRVDVNDFFAIANAEITQLAGAGTVGTNVKSEDVLMKMEDDEPAPAISMDTDDNKPLIRTAPGFARGTGAELPGDEAKSVFPQREGVGKAVCTLGKEPENIKFVNVDVKVDGRSDGNTRYMNDDIRGRVEATRAHLRELGARILERAKETQELPPVTGSCFTTPSSDTVVAIGRVRVDLASGQDGDELGRINESSVLLENEDGHWMRLNLDKMRSQPIFLHRGMIAAVEGVNTNGRELDVTAVHDNAQSRSGSDGNVKVKVEKEEMDTEEDGNSTSAGATAGDGEEWARVIVSAGPYTCMNDLKYEPLLELCDVVKREQPHLVVLGGPFVDASHNLINDSLPVAFDNVFEERVLNRITALATDCPNTKFVILPALGDAHHDFVCPQPPLNGGDAPFPANLFSAPNPSVLQVTSSADTARSLTLGVTTLPTLADISADALCWNSGDRFAAIVSHILRQTSFYPSDPPGRDVPLDSTLRDRLAMPTTGLDALLVPSKLKSFAKVVDGTLAVNPGLLARGNAGGSYASLTLPLRSESDGRQRQRWTEKCHASVVRI